MKSVVGLCIALVLLTSCRTSTEESWVSLMDKSYWKGYLMDDIPAHWVFQEGELLCKEVENKPQIDLITKASFENFILELKWNIMPKGNSGIFYHIIEDQAYTAPYQTAPEYQLIDEINFPSPLNDWQKSAANYAMHPPKKSNLFKGAGQWNSTRIVYDHGRVQHWLNGELVVEFNEKSDLWTTLRASGKWKDYPGYKKSSKGPIGLQDHGVGIRFKDIRIKSLD